MESGERRARTKCEARSMWSVKCGVDSVKCKVWSGECEVWRL